MSLLLHSCRLSDDLYAAFDGRQTPSERRKSLASGAFDAVHEHHRAIGRLVTEGLCGSAFVLRRAMFDGCVRGLWLNEVATDEEIERFVSETYDPKPDRVLRVLKQKGASGANGLRRLYDAGWNVMSSQVHGGYRQVAARLGPDFIGANYTQEDTDPLLQHANWLALLAAVELSTIAGDDELIETIVKIGARFAGGQV